jgi:hypothetical protein
MGRWEREKRGWEERWGKGEDSLPSFPAYITLIYCAVERCELAFFPFKMLFYYFFISFYLLCRQGCL